MYVYYKNESNKNTFGKDESKRSHLQYGSNDDAVPVADILKRSGSGFVRGATAKSQTSNLPMIMTDFHCRVNQNEEDVDNEWQTVGGRKTRLTGKTGLGTPMKGQNKHLNKLKVARKRSAPVLKGFDPAVSPDFGIPKR
ncbi:hypothetical protein HHI36_002479 [Cryptolaemus montrouzieri]|uniref:Uncharacterized protein n=1 Tax=Cryptolaemus montrouzieri TaxID=559131 RepID=A0ABD2PBF9_9CUCU